MDLNSTNKDVKIWLVKVPQFLAESILECDTETELGELEITKATENENAVLSLQLSNLFCKKNFPTDFNVRITEQSNSMYVVKTGDMEADVEGIVSNECYITPEINQKYLEYKKSLGLKSSAKAHSVQVIDYLREGKKAEKVGNIREMSYLARKRKQTLLENKRERLAKNEVMDLVFKAFEKYSSWTVKDLADFCGQPVAFIQEIVSEICVLNKKDFKNSYELKPEYK